MATAERHAGREVRVPDEPKPEEYSALAAREKAVRKEQGLKDDELSVRIQEKGPFGLYSISVAKKDKDGNNVRDTAKTPRFIWLPIIGKADISDVIAWFEARYPGAGERTCIQRAIGQELVSVRSKSRLKGGGGGRRGKFAA